MKKMERRGRPKTQPTENVKVDIWELSSKDYTGEVTTIKFNKKISPNGPYSIETTYPKGTRSAKVKAEKNKPYGKLPVVLVFKTSNRSNAKTKIKVFKNENIDYILSADKLVGVPSKAEIVDVGVGISFVERYKQKYNLA
jgi:hypothetical protein